MARKKGTPPANTDWKDLRESAEQIGINIEIDKVALGGDPSQTAKYAALNILHRASRNSLVIEHNDQLKSAGDKAVKAKTDSHTKMMRSRIADCDRAEKISSEERMKIRKRFADDNPSRIGQWDKKLAAEYECSTKTIQRARLEK